MQKELEKQEQEFTEALNNGDEILFREVFFLTKKRIASQSSVKFIKKDFIILTKPSPGTKGNIKVGKYAEVKWQKIDEDLILWIGDAPIILFFKGISNFEIIKK